jgi:hypothetical protein
MATIARNKEAARADLLPMIMIAVPMPVAPMQVVLAC